MNEYWIDWLFYVAKSTHISEVWFYWLTFMYTTVAFIGLIAIETNWKSGIQINLHDCMRLYRVAQKIGTPFLYALTLPNINQFSKLFHCQNQEKICNNTITKDPTTPLGFHTPWNIYGTAKARVRQILCVWRLCQMLAFGRLIIPERAVARVTWSISEFYTL